MPPKKEIIKILAPILSSVRKITIEKSNEELKKLDKKTLDLLLESGKADLRNLFKADSPEKIQLELEEEEAEEDKAFGQRTKEYKGLK